MPAVLPANLKQHLKKLRHRARLAYINRFHSFTAAQFQELLQRLGVGRGTVVCVHSSFDQFAGFRGNVGDALKALQETVGPEGGLIMPTQPFSNTAIDYVRKHPVTELARAPSLMGMLTEILRRTRGAVRSINPTHPIAAWGERGVALIGRDWEARTPCGQGTAYHRLLDADARILMLGTGLQPMTFYHCVEEIIEPMMPDSPFTTEEFQLQTRDAQGNLYTSHMRLFEPRLSARRSMQLMIPQLHRQGFWQAARVGRLEVIALRAVQVLEACRTMAAQGRFCYEGLEGR
jgi:aminoglycoside 3-N-acetyltransferase